MQRQIDAKTLLLIGAYIIFNECDSIFLHNHFIILHYQCSFICKFYECLYLICILFIFIHFNKYFKSQFQEEAPAPGWWKFCGIAYISTYITVLSTKKLQLSPSTYNVIAAEDWMQTDLEMGVLMIDMNFQWYTFISNVGVCMCWWHHCLLSW